MPVYKTRKSAEAYGYSVGILLAAGGGPRVPGDVANATSYGYPVLYRAVPDATVERLRGAAPELEAAVVAAARALAAEGVKGITSNCSFFANYQEAVTSAVEVPVFLSSLLQLPFISANLARGRAIGVITADARALGNRLLASSGVEADRPVVVRGLDDQPEFRRGILLDGDKLDTELVEAEVAAAARRMVAENPDMGAILIECAALPRYAKAVQAATGLPVFDFLTMIDFFQKTAHREPYSGYY
jgi:Asp/Glu/hydantoin racemase